MNQLVLNSSSRGGSSASRCVYCKSVLDLVSQEDNVVELIKESSDLDINEIRRAKRVGSFRIPYKINCVEQKHLVCHLCLESIRSSWPTTTTTLAVSPICQTMLPKEETTGHGGGPFELDIDSLESSSNINENLLATIANFDDLDNIYLIKKHDESDHVLDELATFKCRLFGIRYKSPESKLQAFEYIFKWLRNEKTSQELRVLVKRVVYQKDEKTGVVNQAIYEIVLRLLVESKLINMNVMLTRIQGMADCTDMSILDGEVDQSVLPVATGQYDKIWINTMVESRLEKEIKEIMAFPNKIRIGRPEDTVLCRVMNAHSPYEIWVQDIVDATEAYDQFQTLLGVEYAQLIGRNVLKTRESYDDDDEESDESLTSSANPSTDTESVWSIRDNNNNRRKNKKTKWRLDELCVLRKIVSNTEIKFYRAKIVEILKNGDYKVICLDDGNYVEGVSDSELYELTHHFREPEFKAKYCYLSGVKPTGTSNGEWSKAAKAFVLETLPKQQVLVRFERPKCHSPDNNQDTKHNFHIANVSHEVTIFIQASPNNGKGGSSANLKQTANNDEKYVRYSDIMNNSGLALLTEKQKIIEKMIINNEKPQLLFSSFSLAQPCQRFAYPVESIKIEKEFNVRYIYDAVVSHVDLVRPNNPIQNSDSFHSGRSSCRQPEEAIPTTSSSSSTETYNESDKFIEVYFHVARVNQPSPVGGKTISQNMIQLDEMSREFEKCFQKSTTDCGYAVRFLREVAKTQSVNLLPQACVCRLRDGLFYRGEILDIAAGDGSDNDDNDETLFRIRAIDHGFLEDVPATCIFRPMETYLKTPRLVRKAFVKLPDRIGLKEFLSEYKRKYVNRLVCLKIEDMIEYDDDKPIPVVKIYELKELVTTPVPTIYFDNQIMSQDFGRAYNTLHHMSSYLHTLFFDVLIGWYQINFDTHEIMVYLQFVFSESELGQDTVGLDFADKDRVNLVNMHKEFKNISEQIMSLNAQNSLRRLMTERVIRAGERCCALYSDQNIYRGLVKTVNYRERTALVQYVDFGNEETVSFDKIFVLDDQFASLPEQAICVKLAGLRVSPSVNESSKEANRVAEILDSMFYEMAESSGKRLMAQFYSNEDEELKCELYLDEPMDDGSNIIYSCLNDDDEMRVLFDMQVN